jgi:hypothetical protein
MDCNGWPFVVIASRLHASSIRKAPAMQNRAVGQAESLMSFAHIVAGFSFKLKCESFKFSIAHGIESDRTLL